MPTAPSLPAGTAGELDEFFGRDEDIERICQAVTARSLVTLVGVGGTGKSRIALRVARRLAEGRFTFAGLLTPEELADTAEVARRIAGARTAGGPVLLVVDGCEHAVQSCARLAATLLAEHPGLHLLTTGREALRTGGELVHPVAGLPLPPVPEGLPDLEVLHASDAVRLFLDRARSAGRSVHLTAANAACVVRICRGLDGNPLAIELAASLTAVLPVADIADRLDQCLDLLTRGYRTARPHQHSLRASLDHSLALLSGPARELLDQLGVFAGDFTLAAVEVVCARRPGTTRSPVDLLTELVDKHLVTRTQDWFRLPTPVRHLAVENLHRTGGHEEAAATHTEWCGWLAERIAAAFDGGDDLAALALLGQESENLTAALRRATHADPARAARIAEVMVRYWLRHESAARYIATRPFGTRPPAPADRYAADLRAARHWLEHPAARTGPLPPAVLAVLEGDHERARAELNRLVPELAAAARTVEEALARCALAVSHLLAGGDGGYEAAEPELCAASALYRAAGDEAGAAFALAWRALAAEGRTGDPSGRQLLAEATAAVAGCGDDAMAAALIGARARLRAAEGRHARALELAGAQAAARAPGRADTGAAGWRPDPGLAAAWRLLGERQALEHWEHGTAMSLREALDVAADEVRRRPAPGAAVLSPRELEVVRMVAKGMTSVKIARAFVISPRTVDTHVDHVRTKLGLHSRAEVAAWASSTGIG
ncbi:LuxR C-terminal-related transcriptional regulator [Kitasatospora sp. NPDC048540]|uniref:LuxR C-terminal-related transcriptional regulator n=1 Tax=Kitasatospora sp. NPDC048540 TaxID=3155634 RepID=UPI0033D7F9D6